MLHKCNPQEKSKSSALRLGRTPRRLLKMVISISAGDGLEVVVSISGGYSRVLPEVTPILSFAMVLTFDEVRLPDVVLLDADTNSGGHRNNLTMGRADVGRPGHQQRVDTKIYQPRVRLVAATLSLNFSACDRFDNAAANMRSLGLAIDAMRQLERHSGGTMMERAFSGFAALTAPGKNWWDVLEVKPDAARKVIESNFRHLARDRHPDNGGSHDAMSALNKARAAALAAQS